jgi:hypothetical protein
MRMPSRRLLRITFCCLLVGALAFIWATDTISPAYPQGRLWGILNEMFSIVGFLGVVAIMWLFLLWRPCVEWLRGRPPV